MTQTQKRCVKNYIFTSKFVNPSQNLSIKFDIVEKNWIFKSLVDYTLVNTCTCWSYNKVTMTSLCKNLRSLKIHTRARTHTDTQTQTRKHRHANTDTQTQTRKHRHRHRRTQTQTDTDTDGHRHRRTQTQTDTDTDGHRHRQTETDTHTRANIQTRGHAHSRTCALADMRTRGHAHSRTHTGKYTNYLLYTIPKGDRLTRCSLVKLSLSKVPFAER